jgi:hypothetical protein
MVGWHWSNKSVWVGRGPKGLGLAKSDDEDDWSPFDSFERFDSFFNALRVNSHLERLDLSVFGSEEGILDALTAVLLENKGLVLLGLQYYILDESSFCEFLGAMVVSNLGP